MDATNSMDVRLKGFLQKMHILTLSVIDSLDSRKLSQILSQIDSAESRFSESSQLFSVHCASCFYAFDKQNLSLIFKSDKKSRHITLALQNPIVGVNIATQTKILKHIKGVQIKALFNHASDSQKALYYARFPFARLGKGEIYALKILWAKYTDNSLLRSEKITYQAPNLKP